MMESSIGDTIGKGIKAIGNGIQTLIRKIIEIAKKIKNFIKNLFKSNSEKKMNDMYATDKAVSEAMSLYNISKEIDKDFGTLLNSTERNAMKSAAAINKEYRDKLKITPEELVNKANNAHNMKRDFYDGVGKGNVASLIYDKSGNILIAYTQHVLHIPMYIDSINNLIIPAIKSKFQNKKIVNSMKQKFGPDGMMIPVYNPPVSLDTNSFFPDVNKCMDVIINTMNLPEITEMSNDNNIDPYFTVMLNGLITVMNTINMILFNINNAITFSYQNPFTNYELSKIQNAKSLGEIIRHILIKSDLRNTAKGYNLVQPLIKATCLAKGWINNIDDAKSGASRIVIVTNRSDKFLYKYAWNRKGIFDNKFDMKIKNIVSKDPEVANRFALPTDESPTDGVYVIVPNVKMGNVSRNEAETFNKQLGDLMQKKGIKLIPHDIHEGNIGYLNNKIVVVDYGNFGLS